MLNPANLMRLLSEVLFVLLGALLIWVALTGRVWFDRRSAMWLALAAILIYWGARALLNAGRYAARRLHRVRGGSLVAVGAAMLAIAWAPFEYAGPLLGAAGAVLAARGLVSAVLLLRAGETP